MIGDYSLLPKHQNEILIANGMPDITDEHKIVNMISVHKFCPQVYDIGLDVFFGNYDSLAYLTNKSQGPCSMIASSEQELHEHAMFSYSLAYQMYVFGLNTYTKPKHNAYFPTNHCGLSSRTLFFTFLQENYPNVLLLYGHMHTYVGLPFILHDNPGMIAIDPTFKQLWASSDDQRVHVSIRFGPEWDYETEYLGGANHKPTKAHDARTANESINIFHEISTFKNRPIQEVLMKAYGNPISL
ncbi:MAG: hypothetical protein NDI94_00675 [Candidatus Woesearchaeota archaeon]|nr:hypothetical protein [Candidatus Woesearchaeota archaeon]